MTLSTLQGMNLRMEDLAKAFTGGATSTSKAQASSPEAAREKAKPRQDAPSAGDAAPQPESRNAKAAAGAVDPMQLWGALTQQFQQIAATAL